VTRYNVSVANYINSFNNHLHHHPHMAFTSNTLWGMFSSRKIREISTKMKMRYFEQFQF